MHSQTRLIIVSSILSAITANPVSGLTNLDDSTTSIFDINNKEDQVKDNFQKETIDEASPLEINRREFKYVSDNPSKQQKSNYHYSYKSEQHLEIEHTKQNPKPSTNPHNSSTGPSTHQSPISKPEGHHDEKPHSDSIKKPNGKEAQTNKPVEAKPSRDTHSPTPTSAANYHKPTKSTASKSEAAKAKPTHETKPHSKGSDVKALHETKPTHSSVSSASSKSEDCESSGKPNATKVSDIKPSMETKLPNTKPSSEVKPSVIKPSPEAKAPSTKPSDVKPSVDTKSPGSKHPSEVKPHGVKPVTDSKSPNGKPSDVKPATDLKSPNGKPTDVKPSNESKIPSGKPYDVKPVTDSKSPSGKYSDVKPSTESKTPSGKHSDVKPSTESKTPSGKHSDVKPSKDSKSPSGKHLDTKPSEVKPSTESKEKEHGYQVNHVKPSNKDKSPDSKSPENKPHPSGTRSVDTKAPAHDTTGPYHRPSDGAKVPGAKSTEGPKGSGVKPASESKAPHMKPVTGHQGNAYDTKPYEAKPSSELKNGDREVKPTTNTKPFDQLKLPELKKLMEKKLRGFKPTGGFKLPSREGKVNGNKPSFEGKYPTDTMPSTEDKVKGVSPNGEKGSPYSKPMVNHQPSDVKSYEDNKPSDNQSPLENVSPYHPSGTPDHTTPRDMKHEMGTKSPMVNHDNGPQVHGEKPYHGDKPSGVSPSHATKLPTTRPHKKDDHTTDSKPAVKIMPNHAKPAGYYSRDLGASPLAYKKGSESKPLVGSQPSNVDSNSNPRAHTYESKVPDVNQLKETKVPEVRTNTGDKDHDNQPSGDNQGLNGKLHTAYQTPGAEGHDNNQGSDTMPSPMEEGSEVSPANGMKAPTMKPSNNGNQHPIVTPYKGDVHPGTKPSNGHPSTGIESPTGTMTPGGNPTEADKPYGVSPASYSKSPAQDHDLPKMNPSVNPKLHGEMPESGNDSNQVGPSHGMKAPGYDMRAPGMIPSQGGDKDHGMPLTNGSGPHGVSPSQGAMAPGSSSPDSYQSSPHGAELPKVDSKPETSVPNSTPKSSDVLPAHDTKVSAGSHGKPTGSSQPGVLPAHDDADKPLDSEKLEKLREAHQLPKVTESEYFDSEVPCDSDEEEAEHTESPSGSGQPQNKGVSPDSRQAPTTEMKGVPSISHPMNGKGMGPNGPASEKGMGKGPNGPLPGNSMDNGPTGPAHGKGPHGPISDNHMSKGPNGPMDENMDKGPNGPMDENMGKGSPGPITGPGMNHGPTPHNDMSQSPSSDEDNSPMTDEEMEPTPNMPNHGINNGPLGSKVDALNDSISGKPSDDQPQHGPAFFYNSEGDMIYIPTPSLQHHNVGKKLGSSIIPHHDKADFLEELEHACVTLPELQKYNVEAPATPHHPMDDMKKPESVGGNHALPTLMNKPHANTSVSANQPREVPHVNKEVTKDHLNAPKSDHNGKPVGPAPPTGQAPQVNHVDAIKPEMKVQPTGASPRSAGKVQPTSQITKPSGQVPHPNGQVPKSNGPAPPMNQANSKPTGKVEKPNEHAPNTNGHGAKPSDQTPKSVAKMPATGPVPHSQPAKSMKPAADKPSVPSYSVRAPHPSTTKPTKSGSGAMPTSAVSPSLSHQSTSPTSHGPASLAATSPSTPDSSHHATTKPSSSAAAAHQVPTSSTVPSHGISPAHQAKPTATPTTPFHYFTSSPHYIASSPLKST